MSESMKKWFSALQDDQAEMAKADFAMLIDRAVREKNWTRKQLADAVGVSPAWVTKVLRGDVNLTIDTMAKLCDAVGYSLKIAVSKREDAPMAACGT